MRTAALLALSALLCAQEKSPAYSNAYWGFEIKLPGAEKHIGLGAPSLVFVGRAGAFEITVRVHETEKPKPVALWVAERRAKEKKRSNEAAGPHWLTFQRKDRLGFTKQHGYAYFVRSVQCFEVHAVSDGKPVLDALKAFTLKPDAPGTLAAERAASRTRMKRNDPRVLLAAGFEYLTGQRYRMRNSTLAAKVLALARAGMKKDTFKPLELWSLYEYGGLALVDRPAKAIEWHALAEQAATKLPKRAEEHRRKSAFNLACACAGAKKLDDAFAALYRSYEGGKPVPDGQVSGDKRLESLRRDQKRWDTFWRECVKR